MARSAESAIAPPDLLRTRTYLLVAKLGLYEIRSFLLVTAVLLLTPSVSIAVPTPTVDCEVAIPNADAGAIRRAPVPAAAGLTATPLKTAALTALERASCHVAMLSADR